MNSFIESAMSNAASFLSTIPGWLSALAIFIIGWLLAIVVRLVLSRFLETKGFIIFFQRVGFSEFLRKGQVAYTPGRLVALLCYWVIILAALGVAAKLSGIQIIAILFRHIENIIPGVLTSLLFGVFGYILITFAANFVMTLAKNAALAHAELIARIVKWAGIIFVVGVAVEQLNIKTTIIGATFQIVIAAIAFGMALAFGLGCKDIARSAAERFMHNLREKDRAKRDADLEG
ncbi:MAG: hypothetical protein HZC28_05415 [Spirochaetes bacterium]|nr:hypothetical protein [Spirochaetota bacterium]